MIDLRSKPFYLDDEGIKWVDFTLIRMSPEEKVGQLFCVTVYNADDAELDGFYKILKPGACMYRALPKEQAVKFGNLLRSRADVPMLIAANLEKGGNGIVEEGTLVGSHMEVAATDDVSMAEKMAIVCAEEGKAVGANWAFAPVIDIDYNFRNPITNTRTFGSDPERVKQMGLAYTKTVQEHGMAATIKHFPGDGVDERDQHLVTSVNTLSCEDWDATFGKVYRACIDAGAMTCMTGHIMLPSWTKKLNPDIGDGDILPCSLSKELMTGLLREELGFNGLIITDATTMAGYTMAMSRKDAVPVSIAAGADMFLFTRNLEEDYGFMLDGVNNNTITAERLDEAVTRILALKAALGLHRVQKPLSIDEANTIVGCALHKQWAQECADKAITLVKEQKGVLPLSPEKYRKILFYPLESAGGFFAVKEACHKVAEKLGALGFEVDVFKPSQGMEGRADKTSSVVGVYDLILYVANLATKSNQTTVRIEWAQPMGANCGHYINDVPTVFVSLENPYHLLDFPRAKIFINCYSNNDSVIDSLIEKLMGKSDFKGINPVDPFCGKWDATL